MITAVQTLNVKRESLSVEDVTVLRAVAVINGFIRYLITAKASLAVTEQRSKSLNLTMNG
jgi:hypothetical protein